MVKPELLQKGIYYSLIVYALSSAISIAAGNIATSLAFIFAVLMWCFHKDEVPGHMPRRFWLALGFFLTTFFLSSLFAYDPLVALRRILTNLYRMSPLFFAAYFIKDRCQVFTLAVLIAISAVIADTYALWQGVHGNYRAAAFSSHPMILAGCLIQVIPMCMIMGLHEINLSAKFRAIFYGAMLLSLITLFFNGTRGAWIAVAFILGLYFFYSLRRLKKAAVVIGLLVIMFSVMFCISPAGQERFMSIFDMNNQSNHERLLMWTSAWQMFRDHPLTGVGVGNYTEQYQTRYILPEAKERDQRHAHNNLFHVLAETGIIGTIGFLGLFGYITAHAVQKYTTTLDAWGLVIILVTITLFTQGLTEYNYGNSAVMRLYWMITGLAFVSFRHGRMT
ncbi:O-antigen ligase family protein [Acetonema longum]|uniref:O-antigen polymerase n=1 Tax=Acetonema longum DSM 6540 TaxID=1009370 RepID=F7NLY1_9FIRM|nr:O-antigen ligase family protein [Acetonema longum]EGO62907.1 O-antigen polymerase [Acetonema longum DSM 6540]